MKKTIAQNNRGFTLIETMVAISVLVVAVVVPLRAVSHSLKSSAFTREKVTATFLAQEGLESVKQRYFNRINDVDTAWSEWQTLSGYTLGFRIEPKTGVLAQCTIPSPCELYFNTTERAYTYESSGNDTPYTRSLFMEEQDATRVHVIVKVTWISVYGVSTSVEKDVWIYNTYE